MKRCLGSLRQGEDRLLTASLERPWLKIALLSNPMLCEWHTPATGLVVERGQLVWLDVK